MKYQPSVEGGMTGWVDFSVKLLRKQHFITIKFKCLILEVICIQHFLKYLPIQDMVQGPNNNLFEDMHLLLLHNHHKPLLCRQQIIFDLIFDL